MIGLDVSTGVAQELQLELISVSKRFDGEDPQRVTLRRTGTAAALPRRDVIGQHPALVIPSVSLLWRQPGAMLLVLKE